MRHITGVAGADGNVAVRQPDDLAGERRLGSAGQDSGKQPGQPRVVAGGSGDARLGGLAQDRRDPGVGVLDVVDGILR